MLSTEEESTVPEITDSGEETAARINEALEASDFETAYRWLGELTQIEPVSPQVHTTAALVALQLNRQGEATLHFARALTLSPDDYVTNYNMAITEMQHQRFDLALRRLRHLRKLDGTNADVLNDMGVVWLQKNSPSRALASFSRAMKLDPDHSRARNNAMELCLTRGLTDRADSLLERQEKNPCLSLQSRLEIDCWQQVLCDPEGTRTDTTPAEAGAEN